MQYYALGMLISVVRKEGGFIAKPDGTQNVPLGTAVRVLTKDVAAFKDFTEEKAQGGTPAIIKMYISDVIYINVDERGGIEKSCAYVP